MTPSTYGRPRSDGDSHESSTIIDCRGLGSLPSAWPVQRLAQTAPPTEKASAKETGLEEIVVTAEKRESTVQKTPISMTAISEAEIQARGLEDFRVDRAGDPGRLHENQRPRPNRIRDARTGCDRRLLADRGLLYRRRAADRTRAGRAGKGGRRPGSLRLEPRRGAARAPGNALWRRFHGRHDQVGHQCPAAQYRCGFRPDPRNPEPTAADSTTAAAP